MRSDLIYIKTIWGGFGWSLVFKQKMLNNNYFLELTICYFVTGDNSCESKFNIYLFNLDNFLVEIWTPIDYLSYIGILIILFTIIVIISILGLKFLVVVLVLTFYFNSDLSFYCFLCTEYLQNYMNITFCVF